METIEQQVLAAADRCVRAFGAHDAEAYFASFHPDATFVFHTTPGVLAGRLAWEDEWARLEREDGFRVLGCVSAGARVQAFGDVAVFTHAVATRIRTDAGGDEDLAERETIVFARQPDGAWLAVHEHLSPDPA
jgi:uncharacterized protein (TIGR02246 family)